MYDLNIQVNLFPVFTLMPYFLIQDEPIDSTFELAFLRFRQILLKNPKYFEIFDRSLYPLPSIYSSSSPHIKPVCIKTLRLKEILRFFMRLSYYLCQFSLLLFQRIFSFLLPVGLTDHLVKRTPSFYLR